jgi:membrane protease YdiL (CAAX protease family)
MQTASPSTRSPLRFLALVVALAIPIGLAGRSLGVIGALRIPVSDLGLAFVPMVAALVLLATEQGWRASTDLFKSTFHPRGLRNPAWLLVTLFLAPLIYLLTWALVRLWGGEGIADLNPVRAIVLFGLFFLLAIGEEVGWTGYLTEPLQARRGALGAALIVAGPWWLAHLPSMVAVGATPTDMAWWIVGAVGVRILIVWLFNNTANSILAAVLFHALLNAGRLATFPAAGSHHALTYQIASYLVIGALAAMAVLVCGSVSLRAPSSDATRSSDRA